jgi:hypothetical protein
LFFNPAVKVKLQKLVGRQFGLCTFGVEKSCPKEDGGEETQIHKN